MLGRGMELHDRRRAACVQRIVQGDVGVRTGDVIVPRLDEVDWAADAGRPDDRVDVVVLVDGHPRGCARADQPREDLRMLGTPLRNLVSIFVLSVLNVLRLSVRISSTLVT